MDYGSGSFKGYGNNNGGGSSALSLQPMIVPWTDSRGAQNWVYSTDVPGPLSRGYLWRMEMRSMRVRLDHRYTQAKSGDSIRQLLDRCTNDTVNDYGIKPSQVPPSVAWVLIGTNTGNAYTSALGTIDDYVAGMLSDVNKVLDYLQKQGHGIILCAEWPRGQSVTPFTALLTPDCQQVMYRYAEGLRQLKRANMIVVDIMGRTLDYTRNDYTPLPNMLNPDFLHNSPGISEIVAQEAWDGPRLLGLPELTFDTARAFNSNPTLTKGSGTTAPQNYTLSQPAGVTVTATPDVQITVRGKIRTACRLDITGTPTSANAFAGLRQSGLIGQLVAGDTIESFAEVLVAPGAINFSAPCLMLDTGVSASRLHGGLSITGDNMMPNEVQQSFYGVARSAYGKFDTLPASLSFQFGAYFTLANVASNVTMYVLSAVAQKVV